MFFYQGYECPVCGKAFVEGEDIVSCPHCGLPHHRTCWQTEGKCHLDALHGTERQWSKEKVGESTASAQSEQSPNAVKVCPHCQAENLEFAEFCTRCGRPIQTPAWSSTAYSEYRPFRSPFTSYSPEETIGDHQAKDLAAIVGNNAIYYLPRFRQIVQTGSGGWNWAAFFFAPYWLLYRKNYLLGIFYFVVQTIYSLASSYVLMPMEQATTTEEMTTAIQALLENETTRWLLLPIFLLSVILFAAKILLGLLGNRLYLHDCGKRIDRARSIEGDISTAELASRGGVSMTAAAIAYLIPGILSYILAVINLI